MQLRCRMRQTRLANDTLRIENQVTAAKAAELIAKLDQMGLSGTSGDDAQLPERANHCGGSNAASRTSFPL